jgi:Tfp pilus assembly protein PilZ
MSPSPADRRKSRRIPVRMPLRIQMWRFGVPEQQAECMNVSAGGIFFASASSFHEGDRVEIELRMPEAVMGKPSTWRCEGRVVRVEALDSRSVILGVGVEFERYRMVQTETQQVTLDAA